VAGLEPETVADRVIQAAGESEARSIAFYVLEAPAGRGPDLRFTHSVVSRLRSCAAFRSADIAVRPYVSSELVDFVQDMASCLVAISMKLHSSAICSPRTPRFTRSHTLRRRRPSSAYRSRDWKCSIELYRPSRTSRQFRLPATSSPRGGVRCLPTHSTADGSHSADGPSSRCSVEVRRET
jgi:hypothetical protein